ncbi:MAG: hypothetical protein LQ350_004882 [Teloschistes chrysophthalmus]|nr:MAG: hypothetical protein LQ350_004882 [Niorma chrysophthalma]
MECPVSNLHIAVYGCGFMGTAILQGLLKRTQNTGNQPKITFTAWVRSQSSLERLQHELGEACGQVHCVAGGDVLQILKPADVVILGFPPDVLKSASEAVGRDINALPGKLIISLLAGVSTDRLANFLGRGMGPPYGPNTHYLRVIPSIGAKINDSVTLIAETESAGPKEQKVGAWIFEQLGQVQWFPECLMNEATAVGAACNALMMVAVDAIVDASVAEGLPRSAALKLATSSLRSASGLMLNGGMTPESLKEAMSSPKGITINSVLELEGGHAHPAISDTVRHAIHYTRKM